MATSPSFFTSFLFFLLFFFFVLLTPFANSITNNSSKQGQVDFGPIHLARLGILHATNLINQVLAETRTARNNNNNNNPNSNSSLVVISSPRLSSYSQVALSDCLKLYEDSEPRLARILSDIDYSLDDASAWLSSAWSSHRTCLDGLKENKGTDAAAALDQLKFHGAQNLTVLLEDALASISKHGSRRRPSLHRRPFPRRKRRNNRTDSLLVSWDAKKSKADMVVAQDGSGNYKTINEAVDALGKIMMSSRGRKIVHVKAGVYNENIEIKRHLKNLMFVGDGMDKTIVTAHKSVLDGSTTLASATFGIHGDGFWARDMTFENTAGAEKHQAVALSVISDLSIFYRCSFKGYQDTLFVHSLRQFYRDCRIYGTVDFIFGNAIVVFQNCDILVRKPMNGQSNFITAQGRDSPNDNSGISLINCRVAPAPDLVDAVGRFKSYLGRPWKKYSRTLFLKTELGGLIHPRGWKEWSGNFALSTLYYGEYMNSGAGAYTGNRVNWGGFHDLHNQREADPFSVRNFIKGDQWIPGSGVPFSTDI